MVRTDGQTTRLARAIHASLAVCALVVASGRVPARAGAPPVAEPLKAPNAPAENKGYTRAPNAPTQTKVPSQGASTTPIQTKPPSRRRAEPPPEPPTLTLEPLWEGRVIEVGKLDPSAQQIAVRGALAVAPVSAEANTTDAQHAALLVIDAEVGKVVRAIQAPGKTVIAPFGPLLDGDYAVFATAEPAAKGGAPEEGFVAKVGLDGNYAWVARAKPAPASPPYLIDFDRDGVNDVVIVDGKTTRAWNGMNGALIDPAIIACDGEEQTYEPCIALSAVVAARAPGAGQRMRLDAPALPTCELTALEFGRSRRKVLGCQYRGEENTRYTTDGADYSDWVDPKRLGMLVEGGLFDRGAYGALLGGDFATVSPLPRAAATFSAGLKMVVHTGEAPAFHVETRPAARELDSLVTASASDVRGNGRWALLVVLDTSLRAYETGGAGWLYQSQPWESTPATDLDISYREPRTRPADIDYAGRFRPPADDGPRAAFESFNRGWISYAGPDDFAIRVAELGVDRGFAMLNAPDLPMARAPLAHATHAGGDIWYAHDGLRVFRFSDAGEGENEKLEEVSIPSPTGDDVTTDPISAIATAANVVAVIRAAHVVVCSARPKGTCQLVTDPRRVGDATALASRKDSDGLWVGFADGSLRRYGGNDYTQLSQKSATPVGEVRALIDTGDFLIASGPKGTIAYAQSGGQLGAEFSSRVEVQDVVRCGKGPFYALSQGELLTAIGTPRRFARVPGAPTELRAIACDRESSDLLLLSGSRGMYFLRGPVVTDHRWLWLLGLCALVVLFEVSRHYRARLAIIGAQRQAPIRLGLARDLPLEGHPKTAKGETTRLSALVHALARFIDSEDTNPPITLGIYGPWGSGKSSAMRLLQHELERKNRYISIWFNPWRFHRESDIAAALLQSVVAEVRERAGLGRITIALNSLTSRSTLLKLSWIVPLFLVILHMAYFPSRWSWLGVSDLLAALKLNDVADQLAKSRATGNSLLTLGGLAALWNFIQRVTKVFNIDPAVLLSEKSQEKRVDFLRHFSQELTRVLDALPRAERVVVFVDDLDRCPPDQVVAMLEALNLLTESQRCYFVLGMDPQMVRTAVELKYKALLELKEHRGEDTRGFGASYLEKIVTLAVHVPEVTAQDLVEADDSSAAEQAAGANTSAGRTPPPTLLQGLGAFAQGNAPALLLGCWVLACLGAGAYAFWTSAPEPFRAEAEPDKVPESSSAGAANVAGASSTPVAAGDKTQPSAAKTDTTSTPVASQGRSPQSASTAQLWSRAAAPAEQLPVPGPPLRAAATSTSAPDSTFIESRNRKLFEYVAVGTGATLLLLAAFVLYRRRQAVAGLEPRYQDNPAFKTELVRYLGYLEKNPRKLIRHGNSARLFYYLLQDGSEQRTEPARFFAGLLAEQQLRPIVGEQLPGSKLAEYVVNRAMPANLDSAKQGQLTKLSSSWPPPGEAAREALPDDALCRELRGWLRDTAA